MARVLGIDLPRDKRIEVALTYVYGIGLHRSRLLLKAADIDLDTRVRDMTDEQVAKLRACVEDSGYQLEGDLRRWQNMNVKRLIDIGSYRGRRHRVGLPVRGQRTRTNSRTRRGKRIAVPGKKK